MSYRGRMFIVGNRWYMIQVRGPGAVASSQDAAKFFDSFQVTSVPEQTASSELVGPTWEGSESLSGMGKLTFRFEEADRAIMIDANSTVQGTWKQTGKQIIITFKNCVYTGTIQGQTLAGAAQTTAGRQVEWTFSVTRQAATMSRVLADWFGGGIEDLTVRGRTMPQPELTPDSLQPSRR